MAMRNSFWIFRKMVKHWKRKPDGTERRTGFLKSAVRTCLQKVSGRLRNVKKRTWLLIAAVMSAGILGMAGFVWYANAEADAMACRVYPMGSLPEREIALLLGTSPKTRRGSTNLYFRTRIDAAAELYHAGKVRHILVSGDNSRRDYDEPHYMRDALLQRGVPESAMTLDCAGLRTLDSVVRAKLIFGCTSVTIITQHGHLERAIYLAENNGLDAIGYAAAEPDLFWTRIRNRSREALARAAAWLDIHILHRKPKFLGPTVEIKPDLPQRKI